MNSSCIRDWSFSYWCLSIVLLLAIPGAGAQEPNGTNSLDLPVPMRIGQEIQIDAPFTFVRIAYSGFNRTRSNGAWATDYPDADQAFTSEFQRLTGLPTNPDGLVLKLTDPTLSRYPFIYMVEPGQMALTEAEIVALREYLLGGGFLMMDDFHGEYEWEIVRHSLSQVFEDREPVGLSPDHEIFWSFFAMAEQQPQIPGRGGNRRGTEPKYWGLFADDGRLMAILCHNSDFGDGWEHLTDPWYPQEYSAGQAVPLGVNIVVYALTH